MSEKPLTGKVLCYTSVDQTQRATLTRQAVEMGATCQADLTSDVTHLIAARSQTEKYRFAARHRVDLCIMRIEWISEMYKLWLCGKDIDFSFFEKSYLLPVFFGLRICVTNLALDCRLEVERLVNIHGGTYTGDLTKENTHLIAGSVGGKKWEAVQSWQTDIAMVSIEWLHESIKRAAALDERFFSLELEPQLRGVRSWFPGTQSRQNDKEHEIPYTKKRRRTNTQQLRRPPSNKRLSSIATDGLWANILSDQVPLSNSSSLANQTELLSSISMNIDSTTSSRSITDDLRQEKLTSSTTIVSDVFQGHHFYIEGFSIRETKILQQAVVKSGGTLIDEERDDAYFIIPSLAKLSKPIRRSNAVTECWVERCLAVGRLIGASSDFLSSPLTTPTATNIFGKISICTSGYSGVDLLHVEKMVKISGAILSQTLSKNISILLAPSRECRKFKLAKERGVRIVKAEWLWTCLKTGRLHSFDEFAIDGKLGSACRIDGQLLKSQKRCQILRGLTCLISDQHSLQSKGLSTAISSMGARLATCERDPAITHVIGSSANVNAELHPLISRCSFVSADWIYMSLKNGKRQSESQYLVEPHLDSSLIPKNANFLQESPRKCQLTCDLHKINKRLNSLPVRESSRRKLVGRANKFLMFDNTQRPEHSGAVPDVTLESPSQGITYSDPEAVEQHRKVLAFLNGKENQLEESSIPVEVSMTRAEGLGQQRKLRR